MITITKIFHYEMAHALHRYDGACANIHGHSYRLEVTVTGAVITDTNHPKCGMIMDFGDLKQIVQTTVLDEFDHALVLNSEIKKTTLARTCSPCQTDGMDVDASALLGTGSRTSGFGNVIFVDYQPTNENLLVDFAERIASALPSGVSLLRLRMYETNSSFAEWIP